jgi:hypothetical protein
VFCYQNKARNFDDGREQLLPRQHFDSKIRPQRRELRKLDSDFTIKITARAAPSFTHSLTPQKHGKRI